jgi:hypothetical protein
MAPVELRFNPGGKEPEMTLHEYGASPLVGVSEAEYAAPAKPPGRDEVEIPRLDAIAMLRFCVALPEALSVTLAVKL